MDQDTLSDIMNGHAYVNIENTFNLALFTDAANYNESGSRSMWAKFSSLIELPPILRAAYENIIFHSSWTRSNPDLNVFLEKYNYQID